MIISNGLSSKRISGNLNIPYDPNDQDDIILEENPSSSGCKESIEGALEEQSHDFGMVETCLDQVQVPFEPLSS